MLYVQATRTSLLRAVRTGGAGQLAPGEALLYVPLIVAPQATVWNATWITLTLTLILTPTLTLTLTLTLTPTLTLTR